MVWRKRYADGGASGQLPLQPGQKCDEIQDVLISHHRKEFHERRIWIRLAQKFIFDGLFK